MMLSTKRIDLGDGDYAVVVSELLRKTAHQIQIECRSHMSRSTGKPILLSEVQAGQPLLLNDFVIDTVSIDPDVLAEIYILNQVREWSFGPIDRKTLDDMPNSKYKLLSAELDQLYKPDPLAGNN